MFKIDSNGATVDNKFTEGDPTLSVPATVVSAAWLNAVQGELVTIITSLGIALETSSSDTGDQVYAALLKLLQLGGRPVPINQTLANNQASAADVTGFPQFDKAVVKCVEFLYDILRRTDSGHVKETGRCFLSWDSETSAWGISGLSVFDDSNVDFFATVVSGTNYKLQYKTDNLAGSSYAGNLRITDIKFVNA